MADSGNATLSMEDKGHRLLAVFWVEGGIAMLVVALRFHTRVLMRTLAVEDWLMLIALVLFITALSCATVLVYYGLGRHLDTFGVDELAQFARWNWILQPFGILDLVFVKLSVSIFLLKLLGPNSKGRKWFIYINMVLFTIVFTLASIFSFVQCDPPRALWEQVPGAKCWNPSVQADWGLFGSSYSAFLDFALALLPITILWDLKMNLKQKVSLGFLLGVGVFSGVIACIKTIQTKELAARVDASWATVPLYAWGVSEVFLNIVCGSAPTLKPLYDHIFHRKSLRPATNSYELHSSNNSKKRLNGRTKTSDPGASMEGRDFDVDRDKVNSSTS